MRRLIAAVLVLVVAAVVLSLAAGDPLFVQVRQTEVRSLPGFLSPIVERVDFGTELSYLADRSGWFQVTVVASGATGWVHQGGLQENKQAEVQLQGQSGTRMLTSREIALAGRGFSENLEHEFARQKDLGFADVDSLEARVVDPEQIIAFIQTGRLREDILRGVEQ